MWHSSLVPPPATSYGYYDGQYSCYEIPGIKSLYEVKR